MILPGSSPSGGRPSSKIEGVMVGIVTDNKDPDNLARVKLKLPIREIEQETDWVRIATLMAGNDRGSLFVPEVGDEVLVAFHLGELRKPYVIGVLWNKKQPSPKGDSDKNNIRKIRSRSGHEITFNDDDQDGSITVVTKDGHKVHISDKNDTITVAEKGGKSSLVINGQGAGEVTVKSSNSKVVLSGSGDVTISSDKEIKIKSTQVNIEATATMSLKASASLDLKSDGIINIKGSMVKIN